MRGEVLRDKRTVLSIVQEESPIQPGQYYLSGVCSAASAGDFTTDVSCYQRTLQPPLNAEETLYLGM